MRRWALLLLLPGCGPPVGPMPQKHVVTVLVHSEAQVDVVAAIQGLRFICCTCTLQPKHLRHMIWYFADDDWVLYS